MAEQDNTSESFDVETLPSREAWLARRREGIGASDAAAILGVSPWDSPFTIYCDKLGLEVPAAGQKQSERLKWGALLQDPIAKELGSRLKIDIQLYPPTTIWRCRMDPWLQASLDGTTTLDGRRGAVEIKTASVFERKTWTHEGEVPLPYQVQAQHQMAVTGFGFVLVGVLIGTEELRHTVIERDPEFIPMLVRREEAFWEMVQKRVQPAADGSEEARKLLGRLAPPVPGEILDLADEADIELDARWREAAEKVKEWEAHLDQVKNLISQRMGSAAIARLSNGARWAKTKRGRKAYVANVGASEWIELKRS